MAGWRSVDEQRRYMASRLQRWYPDFRTGGEYYSRLLLEQAQAGAVVLDAGSGTGGYIALLPGRVGKILGVDRDAEALAHNRIVDEKIVADLAALPLPDASVDIITAEFVLEHLESPGVVLREWHRVLKPGGRIIALTSNVLSPVMAVSRMTPVGFHRWVKKGILKKTELVYPTFYRINTARRIRAISAQAGLTVRAIIRAGNPEYLAVHPWLVTPAILLEKYIARRRLRWLQMYLIVMLEKKEP